MINVHLISGAFRKRLVCWFVLFGTLLLPSFALANSGEAASIAHAAVSVLAFLAIAIVAAKSVGAFFERWNLPSVLGELLVGILLGVPILFGWQMLESLRDHAYVRFLAEFSVILLLFQAGLESNIQKMREVGIRAFFVACVGVIAPFVLGYFIIGPWLLSDATWHAHLFLGATLTATSVGITARVFKDLGVVQTKMARIVLGAAVIDDVLGLIILAVVAAIVGSGSISSGVVAWITVKAFLFLVLSIVAGRLLAPYIGELFSRIHRGSGMKMAIALAFCFGYAYLATLVGLAPIVGAFAAGLLLDPVHFHRFASPRLVDEIEEVAEQMTDAAAKTRLTEAVHVHRERHVDDLIDNVAHWIVPIFFVMTGFQVNLRVFADSSVLLVAAGVTAAAIVGKLLSGFVAGKGVSWKAVGVGMIPRGEVGLIFANAGKALGVVDDQVFAAIVMMIVLTTVLTPVALPFTLRGMPKDA
jgi:Kef-type K+ transport system membrane component KefB